MGLSRRDLLRGLVGRDTLRKLGRALLGGPGSVSISRKGSGCTMEEAIRALQDRRPNRCSKLASNVRLDDSADPCERSDQERNKAAGPDSQTPLD